MLEKIQGQNIEKKGVLSPYDTGYTAAATRLPYKGTVYMGLLSRAGTSDFRRCTENSSFSKISCSLPGEPGFLKGDYGI